ncbi:MAG: sigma 54-interacting transcriptional regulator [Acidobacteria bacterium]|nr:sigma 54-interacting transcriptional regulator [Acidobacteriota bacterium]
MYKTFIWLLSTLLIVIVIAIPTFASNFLNHQEPYIYQNWLTQDGLPQNLVKDILQTKDGYLWIASTSGITRFDGIRFTNFNTYNTVDLASNRITSLCEDNKGRLWLSTEDKGVYKYEKGKFTNYNASNGLLKNHVMNLLTTPEGSLLAITEAGIFQYQNDQFVIYKNTNIFSLVRDLAFHPQRKETWITAFDKIICLNDQNDQKATFYKVAEELANNKIRKICITRDGNILVGTALGLAYFKEKEFILYKDENAPNTEVRAIFEDKKGTIWVATDKIHQFKDGIWKILNYFPEGKFESITQDKEENIWIGSLVNGLYKLKEKNIQVFGQEEGILPDSTNAVTEDKFGNIWVSAGCTGLVKITNNQVKVYKKAEDLPDMCVWGISSDNDGKVWFGSWSQGLVYLKEDKATLLKTEQTINKAILSFYKSKNGLTWCGTSKGLCQIKNDELTLIYTKADGLVGDDVRFITEDQENNLWIGTTQGLSYLRLKEGTFVNYTKKNGLPENFVRAIYPDNDGTIWIATYGGGLCRLKNNKFTYFTEKDGLPNNFLSSILLDKRQNFWVSSNNGIFKIKKKDLDDFAENQVTHIYSVLYSLKDGLENNECNGGTQSAGWITKDNKIWFPTIKGVVKIDAEKINLLPPPILIERLLANKKELTLSDQNIIPPDNTDLEISYTALSFVSPEKVLFKYKLEGYDKNWVEVGSRRSAYYTNLSPGSYSFKVIACNNDGIWNEVGTTLTFYIQPKFYQTIPFYFFCIVFLGLVSVAFYKGRINHLVYQTKKLEIAVSERTLEINKHKNSLLLLNQNLEKVNENLLSVLNKLSVGVLVINENNFIDFVNKTAEQTFNFEQESVLNKHYLEMLPLNESDKLRLCHLIQTSPENKEKIAIKLNISKTRECWAEVEVQKDPSNKNRRLIFFYDVSEIYDLRSLIKGQNLFQGIVGESTIIRLVYKQIQDVARVDNTVLILGETGTGKELVARAIHNLSDRSKKPFIAVNTAGLTESMLTSQLFGHKKGSFTGAVGDQLGFFEAAEGGTLFLDEIGDIPLSIQATLLRVLQEKEITRLGETKPRKIDVRIITATHRDLHKAVEANTFRQDLFYRISVTNIHLPALRQRREDIPLLVAYFLEKSSSATKKIVKEISADTMKLLMEYHWPGNVRELKNAIDFAVIHCANQIIQINDLPTLVTKSDILPATNIISNIQKSKEKTNLLERKRILDALDQANGNRAAAARILGIARSTLYRHLKEFGLDE